MRAACLVLMLLLATGAAHAVENCDPCRVPAGGTYRVALPPGWDGHSRLPVLIFLHGFNGKAPDVLADPAITGPAAAQGFLLVAPNGLHGNWSHQGSPSPARDDRTFLRSVEADVKRRWPVDARLVVLGGFSAGASMVWDMACFAPLGFSAFLPFSGGFWERTPTACTAPVNLRHIHGTTDAVSPMTGRTVRDRYRQSDIQRGFVTLLETDRCTTPAERNPHPGGLVCDTWTCRTRRTLQLCLHPGGHDVEPQWVDSGLRWARGLTPR
jgi:polyhydroxybutyrate depolymerase